MTIDEQTHRKLEEIIKTIEKRKETFGKALVGFAFSRNDKSELRVCFGLMNFLGKGEASPKQTTHDYGRFVLTRKPVEVPMAIDLMRSIFEDQVLNFDSWSEVPLKIRLSDMNFVQSRSRYGYISSVWPMLYAYGDIDSSIQGQIPHHSLSKLELPLFPSGTEAINVFFELHLPQDWHKVENRIEFLVPDYRARIKNLRLTGSRITVEAETKRIASKDVLAKFYCKTANESFTSGNLPLEDGRACYVTDEEPAQVEVHIFSAVDGDSIDRRSFDYRYPSREEGIIIENIEVQLLDLINKGENVNVEFKRELTEAQARIRFLETIVAFANTNGGTIFLGVDDNCGIKGFKEDAETRIVDLIADHCDPSIGVQTNSEVLQDVPITLVKVMEGTNKPYTLKDRGIFVRRGSSNRQIKRTELDDIYYKKQSSSRY